jgi:hypothetical protein
MSKWKTISMQYKEGGGAEKLQVAVSLQVFVSTTNHKRESRISKNLDHHIVSVCPSVLYVSKE